MTKQGKRWLGALLALCMVVGMLPVTAVAAEPITGTCGENVTWDLDLETGELTISGTGDMTDYGSYTEEPWKDYWDNITTVTIEEGVTSLGSKAFFNASNLAHITLPNGLKRLGSGAFVNCKNLKEIAIPDGVEIIPSSLFERCGVTKVTLPQGLRSIESSAFRESGLTDVDIPSSVEEIGEWAFGQSALRKAVIPDRVTVLSGAMFTGCSNLEELTFSDKVTEIEVNVIYGCENLTDVYYGGSKSQWSKITINQYTETALEAVTIHYAKADIVYDAGDGSGKMDPDIILKGTNLTLPACQFAAPESRTFKSWEVNGQEYHPGEQCPISDDTVLKALWKQVPTTPLTGTVAKGTYMDADGNMQSYEVEFDTPLTQTSGTLKAGNYYLPNDLTLTDSLVVTSGTVRLDLAGHILQGPGAVIDMDTRTELELYDSDANAGNSNRATHYYTKNENGLWMFDDKNTSSNTWTGGVITTKGDGTAIILRGSVDRSTAASATLYNGSICGNYNAVFCNWYGHLLMAGGAVCGNQNSLHVPSFTMTGGLILDNQGGGVDVSGGAIVGGGETIDIVTSSFLMRGGQIRNNASSGIVANGSVITMYDGEISGNSAVNGGGVYLSSGAEFYMYGGKISNNTAQNRGGGVMLLESENFEMNGGEISENAATRSGGGIALGAGGSFALTKGIIAHNKTTQYGSEGGAGVYMDVSGAFTMTGGEISENTSNGMGGGIIMKSESTFEMSGGKIDSNTGRGAGGGICSLSGFITMTGGEISRNNTYGSGGGIYMLPANSSSPKPTFVMRGGMINENTSQSAGGALCVQDGDIVISGGVIRDNVGELRGIISDGALGLQRPGLHVAFNGRGGLGDTTIEISGSPTITGNTWGPTGAQGNLDTDAVIVISGSLTNTEKIGIVSYSEHQRLPSGSVSRQAGGIFTSGWSTYMSGKDPADYFVSNLPNFLVTAVTTEDGAIEAALVPAHTATFVADGVTVAEIGFLQGATSLDEPDVPTKAHYDGAWESYDLASATSNITVNAVYTQNSDHSASETAVVTSPTCLEGGYTTYTCSVCGNMRVEGETAALGHDYQLNADKSVAATPGHDGYEYYECTRNPAHFYKTPIIAPIVTHTATFMVGDEIIDQVVFEEGAATLDEPALPQRPNYVGQWEPYDLAAATSDITVHGLYTPVDPDAVSDVDAGAKAEYENGEVTMELSARSTSRTIKVVSQQTKPVDVVLVLDQSGSMAETLSTRDRQSKRDALVSCANSFVAELYKNAVDTGADHRVAVVGFAYSAYNKGNYKNTGLLATTIGKAINYNSIKNSDYAAALLPINNSGKINANVVTGINSIVADGATAADLGLKMARNIFAENPIQSERERIVIFITDGTPTSWGEDADLVRQTAAAAISEANMLKNGQGAKIYSVGVHANADPTASFTSAKDGVTTNSRGQFASYDFNRFLHAVSSNYPNAAAMSNLGAGNKADGYYMGVKDTSNLGSIFTNILYSTVYELKSFDKATLYYTLSPEFTLTMEQELAMREELQAQGLADSDIQVIRSQDGTTQFRFQNVKTQAVYGEDGTLHYEAKVRFKVSANQSAPAGGSVSTGTGSNGVEYEGSQIASLETPMVSIPQNRCLVAFTINGQVYQLREMAAGEVITLPDTELACWSVPAGVVVSGEYAVFEADSAPEQKHTIRWIIDGTEMLEQYALGQVIVPPAVPAKEGYDFTGWSRSIPYSMPAYDLVCEAIYSPAHTHSFELAYQTGSCREGLTIVYRCACGETQSMTEQPAEHNFVAVLVDNGSTGTEVEKVVCTKCGHSEEQNINFKVSYSTGWKTTVLDLNLLQNEVNVVQPEAEIEMRFFVGEDGGRLYTVTRIDSDGKRTTYQTQSENGYLVFRANHFSIYVISELDETTSQPTETVSYEEAVNILDSKVDATPTAPLDGTSSSDNNRPVNGGSTRPTAKPAEETPVFSFADVAEQSWYYDSVKYVYEKGLMQGVSATAFAPDQTTSRAMIVTILWRLAGSQQPNTALSYLDCEADSWYAKAVIWANQQDVVKGYGDSNFGPHDPITREQLAVMLYRYAGNPATAGTLDGFVDMNKANDYALDALRWATEQGILTGKGGGLLDPQGQATRAEAAAMLQRFCENEK